VSWRPNGDRAESFAFFVSKKAGPKSFEAAPSRKRAMSHEGLSSIDGNGRPTTKKPPDRESAAAPDYRSSPFQKNPKFSIKGSVTVF
jgi:hypothetical protein